MLRKRLISYILVISGVVAIAGWLRVFIRTEYVALGIVGGCIRIEVPGKVDTQPYFEVYLARGIWNWMPAIWRGLSGYKDSVGKFKDVCDISIPIIYFGCVIVLICEWWAWRKQVKHTNDTRCAVCNYDLRGNDSGQCSECGADIYDQVMADELRNVTRLTRSRHTR